MKSVTKKRLLTGALFAAFAVWTAIGFSPVGHFGLPPMLWGVVEAALLGFVLSVIGFAVAEWADRDD